MGELPHARVTPSPAFYNCGIDYAGPIRTKDKKVRGYKIYKSYIAVFVCFSTKAIHVELVSDLTTDCCLAAIRRFISRRGKPHTIHSDNGTNFVGASNEIRKIFNSNELVNSVSNEGISWRFIPPRSPHFGGIWEAGVRSIKTNLKRVIGDSILTFEQMFTLLTQIEAVLNSRPLSSLSHNPYDLNPLTPGHFLIGRPLMTLPSPTLTDININKLSHYQQVQAMTQHFWNRWRREYLHELQSRYKWNRESPPVHINDLVVIIEDNLPPLSWKMGRITEVHPGVDGVVRVASVQTQNGTVKRSITKLCFLPQG